MSLKNKGISMAVCLSGANVEVFSGKESISKYALEDLGSFLPGAMARVPLLSKGGER